MSALATAIVTDPTSDRAQRVDSWAALLERQGARSFVALDAVLSSCLHVEGPDVTAEALQRAFARSALDELLAALRGNARDALQLVVAEPLTPDKALLIVARIVADGRGIALADGSLFSSSRTPELVLQRSIIAWLLRAERQWTLMAIARAFNRDHSTILYGIEKIDRMMRENPEFTNAIRFMQAEVHAHPDLSTTK